jgi:hypothetical protein
MLQKARNARFLRVADKQTTAVTDQQLIAAPSVGRIVIDWMYFNQNVAGTVEFKSAAGAWSAATGVIGGTFGASGGFIQSLHTMELQDTQPLVYSTTGAGITSYVAIGYHLES